MQKPQVISNAPPAHPSLDYDFLRREGIQHFQRLAGHIWTDHNIHDPGITLWEHICYALTDLGYKIDSKLEDLLAFQNEDPRGDLFPAHEILTIAPVSLRDYRKLIIDVPGVRNAWLEAVPQETPLYYDPINEEIVTQRNLPETGSSFETLELKGLYKILVASDGGSNIREEISRRLHANRSMGMDFTEIEILPKEEISLNLDIEIRNSIDDSTSLLGDIIYTIDRYISPQISFFSLQELLEEGKSLEEIYKGPLLSHGFIKDEELDKFQRKTELRASDLVQEVMDIQGVAVVRNLSMSSGNQKEKWVLPLSNSYTPEFNPLKSNIRFFRNGLEISGDQKKAIEYATQLKQMDAFLSHTASNELEDNFSGRDRELSSYYSLQNHFPENYGIGEVGLSQNAAPARIGQVKQLKAFFVFFEQLLANFLVQSANRASLFSFQDGGNRTYFSQSLVGKVKGLGQVIKGLNSYHDMLKSETEDHFNSLSRKKRFLNHILARFSEQFTEYSLILFGTIQNTQQEEVVSDEMILMEEVNVRKNFLQEYPTLSGRRHLGFNYTQNTSWGSAEVSGLKKRIARLLGLPNYDQQDIAYHSDLFSIVNQAEEGESPEWGWELRQDEALLLEAHRTHPSRELVQQEVLSLISLASDPANYSFTPSGRGLRIRDTEGIIARRDSANLQASEALRDRLVEFFAETFPGNSPENFHIVEHILLRPVLGQNIPTAPQQLVTSVPRKDPYSLQLSYVFPDWVGRFRNASFRQFTTQLVRRETPAYLSIYIHWMSWEDMAMFEGGYKSWLANIHA